MSLIRKISFGTVLGWLVGIGYGAMVGYLAVTSADLPAGKTSNDTYQNFGLFAGALVGLGICLLAYLVYFSGKKQFATHRLGFLLAVCVPAGLLIGAISSYFVHISAASYGMIMAKTNVIVIATVIPAFIGGLVPAVTLLIAQPQ